MGQALLALWRLGTPFGLLVSPVIIAAVRKVSCNRARGMIGSKSLIRKVTFHQGHKTLARYYQMNSPIYEASMGPRVPQIDTFKIRVS